MVQVHMADTLSYFREHSFGDRIADYLHCGLFEDGQKATQALAVARTPSLVHSWTEQIALMRQARENKPDESRMRA
jgi:hypothetical protein